MKQYVNIADKWNLYIVYNILFTKPNQGFTYTDSNKRTSVVVIGNTYSYKQFLNTVVHEAKHVQTAICKYYDVPEESEDAAYLIGYIVMRMSECFNKKDCLY